MRWRQKWDSLTLLSHSVLLSFKSCSSLNVNETQCRAPWNLSEAHRSDSKKLNLSEQCYKRAMASFLTGNDSRSVLAFFNWHWQKRKYDRRSRVSWEATLSSRHATLRLSIPQSSGGISCAAVERCSPTELHLPVFLPEKLTNAHMCKAYKFIRSCTPLGISGFNFVLYFNNPYTLRVCFFQRVHLLGSWEAHSLSSDH